MCIGRTLNSRNIYPVKIMPVEHPSFQCAICQFSKQTASELTSHANTDRAMKKCNKCDFTANTEFAFQLHIEGHHPNPPAIINYPCSTCGTTFSDIRELNDHVTRRHVVHEVPHSSKQEADLKYYLKYIIDQNREMMEDIFEFKKTVNQQFDKIADEQERFQEEFQTMGMSRQKFEQESKEKEKEHQTVVNKGFEALFSGMQVLERHQVHLSKQIDEITSADSPSNPDCISKPSANKQNHQKK